MKQEQTLSSAEEIYTDLQNIYQTLLHNEKKYTAKYVKENMSCFYSYISDMNRTFRDEDEFFTSYNLLNKCINDMEKLLINLEGVLTV